MINHVGNLTLFRWRDGRRTLTLRVGDGGTIVSGPRAPELRHGWECFFVGRHPDHTNFSYRKEG